MKEYKVTAYGTIWADSLESAESIYCGGTEWLDSHNIELVDGYELWTRYTVIKCECGEPMLPNVSTGDNDGYGWICLNPRCQEFHGEELEPEDLTAVGCPEWVAHLVAGMADRLSE